MEPSSIQLTEQSTSWSVRLEKLCYLDYQDQSSTRQGPGPNYNYICVIISWLVRLRTLEPRAALAPECIGAIAISKKFTTYCRKARRVVGCVKCLPLFFQKFIHFAKVTTIVTKMFTKFTTKIGDSWNLSLFLAQNMSLNLVICFISHKYWYKISHKI